MLYFSYGSNMSTRRLRERAPSARFVAVAKLKKHELRFHKVSKDGSGKCDASETGNNDHAVIGVVFDISETGKSELNRWEGLGNGYEEKPIELETLNGKTMNAVTYYATDINSALKPYSWYKNHVLSGAVENGLPKNYIKMIMGVESLTDPSSERHEKETVIYD
ncbi:MAG: gamma-glutamylcyclotransferase [Candidatus Thiodiazotropha sp. (ex Dulcina madagascariensis)]|nr:gamma-glutamylcyclotransferase [Candidatus Thiodiazotropha sp. (ex Dulcina madagascariensis)]